MAPCILSVSLNLSSVFLEDFHPPLRERVLTGLRFGVAEDDVKGLFPLLLGLLPGCWCSKRVCSYKVAIVYIFLEAPIRASCHIASKSRFRCQRVILAQSNDGYRMINELQADHAKDAFNFLSAMRHAILCSTSRFRCQGVTFLAQSNDAYRMIDEPQADHAKDAERPAVVSSCKFS
ncbi:hypothetical protein CDAR_298171 [Caerostris darwini]|uniref:Uncharacterized protein n=1 Tax=Caerostris darwini TaxID=1538125 RepID=A0AAV4PYN1_9ARAC|nr:hypothetical protein CDAR_298171 [Caerostris darwini]